MAEDVSSMERVQWWLLECWHQVLSKYWARGEQATGGASHGGWEVEAVSQGTLPTKTTWL